MPVLCLRCPKRDVWWRGKGIIAPSLSPHDRARSRDTQSPDAVAGMTRAPPGGTKQPVPVSYSSYARSCGLSLRIFRIAGTCLDSSGDAMWILFKTAVTRGLVLDASIPSSPSKRWCLQSGPSSILHSGLMARLGYDSHGFLQTTILAAAIVGRAFIVLLRCPGHLEYVGSVGHGSSQCLGLPMHNGRPQTCVQRNIRGLPRARQSRGDPDYPSHDGAPPSAVCLPRYCVGYDSPQ